MMEAAERQSRTYILPPSTPSSHDTGDVVTADATALKNLMSPTAQETYKDLLPSMTSGMKKYGDAFAQRKLEYATPMYAVYSFTIDGQRYTAAMAYQESKIWKLVRI